MALGNLQNCPDKLDLYRQEPKRFFEESWCLILTGFSRIKARRHL